MVPTDRLPYDAKMGLFEAPDQGIIYLKKFVLIPHRHAY